MNETFESKVLTAATSAQLTRNLGNTCLIHKANKLPYCKRNIMLAMITFWDKVYADIIDLLIRRSTNSNRKWNVDEDCLSYIKEKGLASFTFAEFFFNFHSPLSTAFIKHLKRELNNGMPYLEKFNFLARELNELLNLASIELEGLSISCETFGGEPICPTSKLYGVKDCADTDNIFFVMMNPEYHLEQGLFEEILGIALDYLNRAKDKVIMIVDFKNLNGTNNYFGPKARVKYNKCLDVVEQVYFYHCDGHMTFAPENEDLKRFVIPDKTTLDKVVAAWKNEQKLYEVQNE